MMHKGSIRDGWLLLTIFAGLLTVVALSRWMDAHRPPKDPSLEEEQLYVNGATARRISLGFNGLIADWYWMRSLQYVGGKVINAKEDMQIDNLGQLNMKLLAPLLDNATTLDPEFMEPYQYAAVVLPSIDLREALRITRKGIAANPSAWRLYQHLGYIYWEQENYQAAAEAYDQGSKITGAPSWMQAMKAKMLLDGGSRGVAREMYQNIFSQTTDDHVKEMALKRLLQLDSLDQRDNIRKILAAYQSRVGRCPASWKDVSEAIRRTGVPVDNSGAPLDPANSPYRLVDDGCNVDLDLQSQILPE